MSKQTTTTRRGNELTVFTDDDGMEHLELDGVKVKGVRRIASEEVISTIDLHVSDGSTLPCTISKLGWQIE